MTQYQPQISLGMSISHPIRKSRELCTFSWFDMCLYGLMVLLILFNANSQIFAQIQVQPNDSLFGRQYALERMEIRRVWSITTGSQSIVVAIIGEGFDYAHGDLSANVFVNPREIPNNGIDDDGNGKIDDVNGWDFVGNVTPSELDAGVYREDATPFMPREESGTHIAGIIGAVTGNRIGIAGVLPQCRLLPIKITADDNTNGTRYARLTDALAYAMQMGANIVYCAFARGADEEGYSQAEDQLFAEAARQGIVVIAPAGDQQEHINFRVYPAAYPHVIAVGSLNPFGHVSQQSNRGLQITTFAFGENILSTLPQNQYGVQSGSKQAGAHIVGLVGLLLAGDRSMSANPLQAVGKIREQLRATGIPIINEHQVNVFNAVNAFSFILNHLTAKSISGIHLRNTAPWQITNVAGEARSAIVMGDNRLQVFLSNALARAENISLRLLPASSESALFVDTAQRVSISTLAGDGSKDIAGAEFRVRLTPNVIVNGGIADASTPRLTEDLVLEVRVGGDIVNMIPVRLPIQFGTANRDPLLLEPRHDMGSVIQGTTGSRIFRVVNTGSTACTITDIKVRGLHANDMQIQRLPIVPFILAPSSSAQYSIAFSPLLTGDRTAQLDITSRVIIGTRATMTTQSSVILGNGISGDVRLQDMSVLSGVVVGSATESRIRVQNLSTRASISVALRLDTLAGIGRSEFQFATNNGVQAMTIILQPNEVRLIPVLCSPRTEGERRVVVTATLSGSSPRVQRLVLQRLGLRSTQPRLIIATRSLDMVDDADAPRLRIVLRPAMLGESMRHDIVLFNPQTRPLTITDIRFSGIGENEWTSTLAVPTTIEAGDSIRMPIIFFPRQFGEKSITLTVVGTVGSIPFTHTALDLASQGLQTRVLIPTARPAELITTSNIVRYHELSATTLTVQTSTTSIIVQSSVSSGVGVVAPLTIGVRNTSQQAYTLRGIQFSRPIITLHSALPQTLLPGRSDTMALRVTPSAVGENEALVVLSYSIGTSATVLNDTARIIIRGLPTNRIGYFTNGFADIGKTSHIQFIPTRVGDQRSPIVAPAVLNSGLQPATITVSVIGRDARDFIVVRPFPTLLLPRDASDSVVVLFRPQSSGSKTAQLVLTPPSGDPLVYTLSARALAPLTVRITAATLSVTGSVINIGRIELGERRILRLSVQGQSVLSPLSVRLNGGPFASLAYRGGGGTAVQVRPDEENTLADSVDVVLEPQAFDSLRATMTFATESFTQSFNLRGEYVASSQPRIDFSGVTSIAFDSTLTIGNSVQRLLRITATNLVGSLRIQLPQSLSLIRADGSRAEGTAVLRSVAPNTVLPLFDSTIAITYTPRFPERVQDSVIVSFGIGNQVLTRAVMPYTAQSRYASGITMSSGAVFTDIPVNSVASQPLTMVVNDIRGSEVRIRIIRRDPFPEFMVVHNGVISDTIRMLIRQSNPAQSLQFSTTLTVRFSPQTEGFFLNTFDIIAESDSSVVEGGFTVTGSAKSGIRVESSTQGVEFGIVQVDNTVGRILPLIIDNSTDTITVERVREQSPFSLSIGDAHRVRSFRLPPRANRLIDTGFAVLYTPETTGTHRDTLNFMHGGVRVYMMILGGTGATIVSMGGQRTPIRFDVRAIPSVAHDEVRLEYTMSSSALHQYGTLRLFSIDGHHFFTKRVQATTQTPQETVDVRSLPAGKYLVVIEYQGEIIQGSFIVQR